jgi:hypothetical protein
MDEDLILLQENKKCRVRGTNVTLEHNDLINLSIYHQCDVCLLKEVNRELKRIHIDGCRCNERLNAKKKKD